MKPLIQCVLTQWKPGSSASGSAPYPTIQAIVVRDRRILNLTIRDPYCKRGDEAAIGSALGRALAAEGLVTDLAETAADGLSRARAEVYDLVILDLLMPGTDGFAVLRQLLRDRPGQTVRGPLPLTRLEFLVLKELMEHAGQALSKGQLLESVWGYDFDPGSNIVGVCVSRLRSKIGDHLITTVRGEGYRLAAG